MRLEDNSIYIEDIEKIADQSFPWEKLENKTCFSSFVNLIVSLC